GIRDWSVTGVQTCALPICTEPVKAETPVVPWLPEPPAGVKVPVPVTTTPAGCASAWSKVSGISRLETIPPALLTLTVRNCNPVQIGRASCREREESSGGG